MGALQPGMPSPTMIPRNWDIIIMDLKDWFFTIPLAPEDALRFAFSLPSVNHQKPMQRYHCTVLPQGMKNSPTICQIYVAKALSTVPSQYPGIICYHYMDDILLAGKTPEALISVIQHTLVSLKAYSLQSAPEKIQRQTPWKYLGWKILEHAIESQAVKLQTDIKTLNDLHKPMGSINWVRTLLGTDNSVLEPLFALLKGAPTPSSSRSLTPAARESLAEVSQAICDRQAQQIQEGKGVNTYIINQPKQHVGLLSQWNEDEGRDPLSIIEWFYLPHQPQKTVVTHVKMFSLLIRKGRRRTLELTGREPETVFVPLTQDYLTWCQANSLSLQVALENHTGQISIHFPSHKLLSFCTEVNRARPPLCQSVPVDGFTLFTDGSSWSGKAAIVWYDGSNWQHQIHQTVGSPEIVELPLNMVTNSQ